jgi:hypothetical protein
MPWIEEWLESQLNKNEKPQENRSAKNYACLNNKNGYPIPSIAPQCDDWDS